MKTLRGVLAVSLSVCVLGLITTSSTGCFLFHKKPNPDKTFAGNVPPETSGQYPVTGGLGAGVDSGETAGIPPAPREAAENQVPELRTVYFDFDSSDLSAEARQSLDSAAEYLKSHADLTVQVQGHCDERGTREYNMALGEHRADNVRAYLMQKGIPAARLNAISYGSERPVAPGHDESAWRQNRRVQFMSY